FLHGFGSEMDLRKNGGRYCESILKYSPDEQLRIYLLLRQGHQLYPGQPVEEDLLGNKAPMVSGQARSGQNLFLKGSSQDGNGFHRYWETNYSIRQYHRSHRKNICRNQPVVFTNVDADSAGITGY